MSEYTDNQAQAAKEALTVDLGACNVAGVARTLHEAAAAWIEATKNTGLANICPPVRLIMHQLNWLVFGKIIDFESYEAAKKECETIVGSKKAEHDSPRPPRRF